MPYAPARDGQIGGGLFNLADAPRYIIAPCSPEQYTNMAISPHKGCKNIVPIVPHRANAFGNKALTGGDGGDDGGDDLPQKIVLNCRAAPSRASSH